MIQFKVGDKVVYPNHGVGVIEKIQSQSFGDGELMFYALRILANDSTVLVPTANTKQVGLRPIMRKKEVSQVYDVLQSGKFSITDDWKGRYQENCERMRTGSRQAICGPTSKVRFGTSGSFPFLSSPRATQAAKGVCAANAPANTRWLRSPRKFGNCWATGRASGYRSGSSRN